MLSRLPRPRATALALLATGALMLSACSDGTPDRITAPLPPPAPALSTGPQGINVAIAAQERHSAALMAMRGVVGTAVGLTASGRPAVMILTLDAGVHGLPTSLDGVPVITHVSGLLMALSDPTTRLRPAPMGYSVGHPQITAGSIGARVVDGSGNRYLLSNNHVLANSNNASIGDPEYQPGPYDGGTAADQVATLSAFKQINFSGGTNTIDAAIAITSTPLVDNTTPADDGYGQPSADIYGDANHDGTFDNTSALLGLNVQKYGRTTQLTHGQITGINGQVSVCYEVLLGILCTKSATYTDQLIVTPGAFSGGGDSGSLIVSDDGGRNPVGLLFAGSSSETIANRIDLVLGYFHVAIDGGSSPPATPLTDVAVTGISAPASVTQGNTANVTVTVRNVGNQDVASSFNVTLRDETDNVDIGTQAVGGLSVGATATPSFSWNTTSGTTLGTHTLSATQDLGDDNATNDAATTDVTVGTVSTAGTMHVGNLDGSATSSGRSWYAIVEVTVHDENHNPLNGVTVNGQWNIGGLNVDQCTTGELGGNGTCIFLAPSVRKKSVTFTVTSVTTTMPGWTYTPADNHDPDGDSNGTSITVARP